MKKLRIGVIGVGLMGKTHATNLITRIPNGNLSGIADSNIALARKVGGELGISNVYSDYRELINNDVDAVIIATPSFAKPELVSAALEKGKHVFCEKPLCVDLDDAKRLESAVKRSGLVFQMGFQRRFDPSLLRAKEAVESGKVGKILLITSRTRDQPGSIASWEDDPKLSGGIFSKLPMSEDKGLSPFQNQRRYDQLIVEHRRRTIEPVYRYSPIGNLDVRMGMGRLLRWMG
jgi:myo-inositol 2-dehydrogenase/D-chiro-inositol 1-dehydrogenase